jgi:hypothetical protein
MSAALMILYRNLGLDATWSASTAVATLPARHLADPNRKMVCRSTGLNNPWRLVADLGADYADLDPIKALGLVDANVTTGATITFKSNDTNAWGAPADSASLVPWDAADTGVLLKVLGATWARRYLAIEITDLANPDGYYELGVPVLSPAFSLPRGAPHEFAWGIVDPSKVSRAPDNTPKTEKRAKYAEADMAWHQLAESVVFGEVQTFLRAAGISDDVILSVFSGDPDADDATTSLNLYGRFVELPKFVYAGQNPVKGNVYDWGPVAFRESGAAAPA